MPSTLIPEISNERLEQLAQRIKPVIRFAQGLKGKFQSSKGTPHYITPTDLRTQSFMWSAKPTARATKLIEVDTIATYHTYGYAGFFKPSIAEVLAAIQNRPDIESIVAFEITGEEIYNDECHQATTVLYRSK